jgi:hypothetical protein
LSTSALVTRRLNLLAYDSGHLAPLKTVNYFIETIKSVCKFHPLKGEKDIKCDTQKEEPTDKEGKDRRLNGRSQITTETNKPKLMTSETLTASLREVTPFGWVNHQPSGVFSVHAEEEYRRFFRNAGTHLPSYTVSQ